MKNVNIKKVVAGAAALAIAAGSLGAVVSAANVADSSYTTPNGLARADMFNAQGAPSYNIVVGSTGHASDVVWAANIAAAIGKKAYNVSTASATGGDVVVEVGSEFTSTSITDGKIYENHNLIDFDGIQTYSIKAKDYSGLVRQNVEYDIAGNTTTLNNVEDSVEISIDKVYFENSDSTRSLLAQIPSGGVTYTVDLKTTGIPNTLSAGGDHDVYIPFLGKEYKVRSTDSGKIVLVLQENTGIYNIDDTFSIDGKGTYSDKELTIKVGTVTQNTTTTSVLLTLMDGSTTLETKVVRDGRTENFGNKTHDFTVSVNYADNQTSYIEVSTGSDTLELENGEVIDKLTKDGVEWRANYIDADPIKLITIENDTPFDGMYLDSDDYPALTPGDRISLPGSLGSIDFMGLKNETMHEFKTNNGYIEWLSAADDLHKIPMYEILPTSGSKKITIDGFDYYFHVISGAVAVTDNSTYNVADVLDDASDTPLSGLGATDPVVLESDLRSAVIHNFMLVQHDTGRLALALDATTTPYTIAESTATWEFLGTDTDGVGDIDGADVTYFNGAADRETDVALFTVTDYVDSTYTQTLTANFDPYSKRLINTDKYGAPYLDKVTYDSDGLKDLSFNDFRSEDLRSGITYRGSEVSIANGNLSINQPEKVRTVQIAIGGGVSSSTTMLGSEVTLTTPGEVVDADGIKVKLVSAPQGSATTYTPAAFGNIAYLDTDTLPAGNKIIVGGWMVNEEAKNLGLQDLVTKAGDFVAGKNAQGNIVVAGFHKEDTANAAKELISAIEAMN